MTIDLSLHWLPPADRFADLVRPPPDATATEIVASLRAAAGLRLDFLQTRKLDRAMATHATAMEASGLPRIRLALLGSGTLDQLVPGIRVGALRRGLLADVWVAPYGQWRQQALDPSSELAGYAPDVVLLSLEGGAIVPELPSDTPAREAELAIEGRIDELTAVWRAIQDRLRATVIQQTILPDQPALFGHLDRLVPSSPAALAARLDARMLEAAARDGVLPLDLRAAAGELGARGLVDPTLWFHAKQAIGPAAVPWAGDQVARILAALRGLSKKVLVLDLDNTLWGGVVGDDGVDGLVLGQGSGTGEAYAAFQRYAKQLAGRGIVLAVSSKNEPATAEAPFREHPEMVLRREDIAAFEAGWHDKPSALRRIAADLDLGIDSLVFFDDNPAERELVRRTLPMVAVPEVPTAPELYVRCLADSGWFEAVSFTADDAKRAGQYAANAERRRLQAGATDLEGFLRDLDMTVSIAPFRPVDLARVTQLINKTNQFNLTTRRHTEAEVKAMMADPDRLTFAVRVTDRFGDNGLVSVVIGRRDGDAVELDTWLMSCRVLGRKVEDAVLHAVAEKALAAGAHRLIGRYRPTAKNGLVRDMYPRLGFAAADAPPETPEEQVWELALPGPLPAADHVTIRIED